MKFILASGWFSISGIIGLATDMSAPAWFVPWILDFLSFPFLTGE